MTDVLSVPTAIVTVAVIGGSISGALHGGRRHMDSTGILMVAVVTGLGGGAIRDILLAQSVPGFLLNNLIALALIGALAGFFFTRLVEFLTPAIFVVDTLLIGVWVIVGAEEAQNVAVPPVSAVFVGVTTAVGGGLIRDVLCREVPSALMPGEFVAASALAAAVLFVAIDELTGNQPVAEAVAIMTALLLRVASARLGWITPNAVDLSDRMREWLGLVRR
jgi:uncharacterized membrane protein YeiH